MVLEVLNQGEGIEDPSGIWPLAQPERRDWEIAGMAAGGVNGVSSGCLVTAQGSPNMTVAVASGTVVVNNVEAVVSSGNVTITAAHATLRRRDLIVVNSSGVKSAVAGTAASVPASPAIPASSVVIALVYVPAADTAINSNQIADKRVTVPIPSSVGGWTTVSKASDQSKVSDTTLANDSVLFFTMAANTVYRIRGAFYCVGSETGTTLKARWVGPASPTEVIIHTQVPNSATGLESSSTRIETAYSSTDIGVGPGTGAWKQPFYVNGIVQNGNNAGTFALQWAQLVSDTGQTIMRGGSSLDYSAA